MICFLPITWWRNQLEAFSPLLAIVRGITGGFPSQRSVRRSFDVFFDQHQNKPLSKQSRRRWFGNHSAHYDVTVRILQDMGHDCPNPSDIPRSMMTSSNENIFRVTGPLCGEFTGHRWIPSTKASDAELWCFLDLRLNKRLCKQSWGWWSETPSRHYDVIAMGYG